MRQGFPLAILILLTTLTWLLLSPLAQADLAEAWTYSLSNQRAAISDSGGVYVVGVPVANAEDVVLHRIRTDGTLHWTQTWDNARDFPERIGVDGRGHAYVSIRNYSERNRPVLLCYDSLGTLLWEDWPDAPGLADRDDLISDLDVSREGYVALAGYTDYAPFCDSYYYNSFIATYGPTGLPSRNIVTLQLSDYSIDNSWLNNVSVDHLGRVLMPTVRHDPDECIDVPNDCQFIDGCEWTIVFSTRLFTPGGYVSDLWTEDNHTQTKFFDDNSFCVWENGTHINDGPQDIRYHDAAGNLVWSNTLDISFRGPFKDGAGNVYVVAHWYTEDASPLQDQSSPEESFSHILKFSPNGTLLRDFVLPANEFIMGSVALEDGRFVITQRAGMWPGLEWSVVEYDANLNVIDQIALPTGQDYQYIIGADVHDDIYVRSERQLRKIVTDKNLTIVDINGDPMATTEFTLSTVTTGAPVFNFDTLGTFTTDLDGKLPIAMETHDSYRIELDNGPHVIPAGDEFRISKHVHAEPARRHGGTAFNIHLDNARFDSDGAMSYDELSGAATIIMDHTEVRYNLMVSLEWRATADYINYLVGGLQNASNYLYDITDGQARFDTLTIYSEGSANALVDMFVKASNVAWAYAENGIGGIWQRTHETSKRIIMPRKFYGDTVHHRNLSYSEATGTPGVLNVNTPTDYRTKVHEFGHYAFGFYDEYLFWNHGILGFFEGYERDADATSLRCQPRSLMTYGFMDYQYDYGTGIALAYSSEMSSKYRYQLPSCQNTKQFREFGMSCWDYFEHFFESRTWGSDNLHVPILKPDFDEDDERHDLTPINTFIGPNNNLSSPDYEVGARLKVVSHAQPTGTDYINKSIRVAGVPGVDRADVVLNNDNPSTLGGGSIYQGRTSDDGRIWVLGVYEPNFTIDVTKNSQTGRWSPTKSGVTRGINSSGSWYYGSISSVAGDSAVIELREVDGDYPMLVNASIDAGVAAIDLLSDGELPELPTLDLITTDSGMFSYTFGSIAEGYSATVSNEIGGEGQLVVHAVDGSAASFLFYCPYKKVDLTVDTSATIYSISAPSGMAEVLIDTVNSSLEEAVVVMSSYPVPLTGVGGQAVQVGPAYTLALQPQLTLDSSNQILIRYSEDDLLVEGGTLAGMESMLAVYRWDETGSQWEPLTSAVDTTGNMVAAQIEQAGVFALFANQVVSDVDDEGYGQTLPYRFELEQNYPNPFNPATTIEYSLPERTHVIIDVLNVLGQRVRTLVNREESAGVYTITWDGKDASGRSVATGVYLYRFQADDHVQTKKMMLVK